MREFADYAESVELGGRSMLGELGKGVGRLMKPEQKQKVWKGEARLPKRTR
jgi:hypothetical protein